MKLTLEEKRPCQCTAHDDLEENGTITESITISIQTYACIKNVYLFFFIICIIIMLKPDESVIFEIAIFSLLLKIQTSNFETSFRVLTSLSVQNLE